MPWYRVNVDQVQYAITVLRRQRATVEEQVLPELMQALNQELVQGYPKVAMEVQQAMDESNKFFQQLSNTLRALEESLTSILTTYKQ